MTCLFRNRLLGFASATTDWSFSSRQNWRERLVSDLVLSSGLAGSIVSRITFSRSTSELQILLEQPGSFFSSGHFTGRGYTTTKHIIAATFMDFLPKKVCHWTIFSCHISWLFANFVPIRASLQNVDKTMSCLIKSLLLDPSPIA